MKKYFITFLFPLFLAVVACDTSHDQRVLPSLFEGPVSFGDGEDFSPDADESVPFDPGEETSDEEDEVDDEESCASGSFSVNPSRIDFGLGEVGTVECQIITVNGCQEFSAEVDDSSDKSTVTTSDGATERVPEFELYQGEVSAQARLTGLEDSIKICYKRVAPRTQPHRGRVNIVVTNGLANYGHVVSLSGQTGEKVFTSIAQPVDGQLVWERDFGIEGTNFVVPTAGHVNAELASIYSGNNIAITSAGGSTTTTFGEDFSFSGNALIPLTPDIYPITFSLTTTRSSQPSTATVNVIRYTRPDATLEVRDLGQGGDGELVTSTSETDSTGLMAGVVINNLPLSGPQADQPLEISFKLTNPDGEWVYSGGEWKKTPETADIIDFYSGFVFGDSTGSQGLCGGGFATPEKTYCVNLPPAHKLGKGVNTFTATICSEYTDFVDGEVCVVATSTIIVDNGLPKITIYAPQDNRIYHLNNAVVLRGKVENFSLPQNDANGNPVCAVKLWVNTSVLAPPVADFCPYLTVVEGEVTDANTGDRGNIKKATFEMTLDSSKLYPYTNLIRMTAENARGHVKIKVVSFQRGEFNRSTHTPTDTNSSGIITTAIGDLTSGQLGTNSNGDGSTRRAPIMIDIGEDKLQSAEVMAVIKKALNDNLKFADLAMGGGLKKDDDDNIEPIGTGTNTVASRAEINRMLHGTAPEQVRALMDYQRLPGNSTTSYFPAEGSGDDIVAQDFCEQPITTAIITPNVYQYLFPNRDPAFLWDEDVGLREWPGVCNERPVDERANCDTTEQGVWDIDLDLKDDGFIDATLSLEGVDGKPAFWGHFTAYNLIEEGSSGAYGPTPGIGIADPVIPLLMNVGRLEIRLRDMVRLYKVEKYSSGPNLNKVKMCTSDEGDEEPCPCENSSNCTNMLYFYSERIHESSSAFRFEPYEDCADYFHSKYPGQNLPFGCNEDNEGNFPFTIDTTSPQGYLLWDVVAQQGSSTTLLTLIRSVFTNTFKNVISCLPNQIINPIIDPTAFPYPEWTDPDDQITDLTLAMGTKDDEIFFKLKKDLEVGEIAKFTLTPNIKDADIIVKDDHLQARLNATLGATGVVSTSVFLPSFDFGGFFGGGGSSVTKRVWGHMYRNPRPGFQNIDRLVASAPSSTPPDLSLSIGIEEILHTVTHILWKKGPLELVDLFDSETYADLDIDNNWKLGLDKVILGRLDICDGATVGIAGLMRTDLSISVLFKDIANLFNNPDDATHLDVSLDPNFPPTLALTPLEFDSNGDGITDATDATTQVLRLGLTKVRVDAKNLMREGDNTYSIGCNEASRAVRDDCDKTIVSVRLDGVLNLIVRYDRSGRVLDIFIPPHTEQPVYLSVINGGGSFNDVSVLKGLEDELLAKLFSFISSTYIPGGVGNTPSLSLILPEKVTAFENFETVKNAEELAALGDYKGVLLWNMTRMPGNGTCEGITPPEYASEVNFRFINPISNTNFSRQAISVATDFNNSRRAGRIRANGDSIVYTAHIDRCVLSSDGNEIAENLCDLGILDIGFSDLFPNLVLDVDNGYIHLSTDLDIEAQPWLWEEVEGE